MLSDLWARSRSLPFGTSGYDFGFQHQYLVLLLAYYDLSLL